MSNHAVKLELSRLRRAAKVKLRLAFDGMRPDSLPTPGQQQILQDGDNHIQWVLGGNGSGKSQLGGRVVSWWFNNDHPHIERPVQWGDGPVQILVVGRVGEQIESELWEKKIKPFLTPGTFKVVKIGNAIQRVLHTTNGNRIIFMSHHDAVHAREKVQAFTTNIVWLDEMPDHAGLVTELVMRVLRVCGYLYGTFTPLIKNEEIRKIVDSGAPSHRKTKIAMLDNPIYLGREAEVVAQVRAACSSEDEFNARMYGDWYAGDNRVFAYSATQHRVALPPEYSPGWRHVAVTDPAASGLAGLTVWAEDPRDGRWFGVLAKYLKGAAAFDLLDSVEAELVGLNLVARWCDCNPAGFYKEAARRGVPWRPIEHKADRKLAMIDKFNTLVLTGKVRLTDAMQALEDELVKAVWSERKAGKIVNGSSYHCADTAEYFADIMPEWDPTANVLLNPIQQIRQDWKARQARESEIREYRIQQRRGKWKRPSSYRVLSLSR